MKKLIYSLSLCTLLLAACGNQKEYPTMSEVKAQQEYEEGLAQKEAEAIELAKPIEQRIESYINEELGPETNNNKQRIISIINSNSNLKINLNADDSLTIKSTKQQMLIDSKVILEELKSYGAAGNVEISFNIDLVDVYGNVNTNEVLVVALNKETLHSIQYDNFDFNDLGQVADDYFVHPVFQ